MHVLASGLWIPPLSSALACEASAQQPQVPCQLPCALEWGEELLLLCFASVFFSASLHQCFFTPAAMSGFHFQFLPTVLEPKLIPKSYFYNSKRNFSSITCGSSEPSQRQDLYLSFSCPRHPSQSVPGTSQALKGYPTEPNQFSLPLCHVGSKGETCSFPSSQFFMQMADVWPLTHFGLHDSRIIHSLPSHLPTLLPVKSKSTSSSKAVGIKKQRHHFANKDPSSQSYGFSSSHVRMWGLNHKEAWTPKNWCFQTVGQYGDQTTQP